PGEAMPSWRPVRTRPRRRTRRRLRVAYVLALALIGAAVGLIVWNRGGSDSPPARASLTPAAVHPKKPKLVHRRLAHTGKLDLYAIVVAERLHRLDFRNAHTFRLVRALTVPCAGVNHMDFSANGRYVIASCEFSGRLLKVDVRRFRVLGVRALPRPFAVPQDVRSSPDAKVFYVADLAAGGVWEINPARFKVIGFIHTGAGAHGLVVGRNGKVLYVANR